MSIGRTHLARGQQDVSEAFKALIDPYKINDTVAAKVKYHRWVELPNQTEGLIDADPIDREKFSVVQRDGKLPKTT